MIQWQLRCGFRSISAEEGKLFAAEGQANISTVKTRNRHDLVIVQEKLDGSNVSAAKVNGEIVALTRAGYLASTSPYLQHHPFGSWVKKNERRFKGVLQKGERLVGEWLAMAAGTRYNLPHEPFVAFDLMAGKERKIYAELVGMVLSQESLKQLNPDQLGQIEAILKPALTVA